MKKLVIVLVIVLGLMLGEMIIVGVGLKNNTPTTEETATDDAATDDTAAESDYNTVEVEYPSDKEIGDNPIATVKIEGMDEMKFVLFPDKAPQSVYNFISIANSGFYDGLTMHRIVTDFVAQGGDETGTGAGPSDYTIKGEFPSNGVDTGLTHKKGAIAWARSADPDSAGTQFYICLNDDTSLDPDYAVFGYMTEGAETLEELQKVSSASGTPTEDVIIESVSVDTKGEDYPEPDKL